MKPEGRAVISCSKQLPSGHTERFRVVVDSNTLNDAKRNYESQGYKVVVIDGGK